MTGRAWFFLCLVVLHGYGGERYSYDENMTCGEIMERIDALEKQKKANTVNRVGHFIFGGILKEYGGEDKTDEELRLLRMKLRDCKY